MSDQPVPAAGQSESQSRFEIIGPFDTYKVAVHGRRVPFLQAFPMNGGKISLLLDDRFSADISVADADMLIPFIADCIAVAMGYACHPHAAESMDIALADATERQRRGEVTRRSPFPAMHAITSLVTEEAQPDD